VRDQVVEESPNSNSELQTGLHLEEGKWAKDARKMGSVMHLDRQLAA
jgi:hypothetical protein